jgi:fatty acid desaturase
MGTSRGVAEDVEPGIDPRPDWEPMEVATMENKMIQRDDLRALARSRLVKRREFTAHIAAYVLVNVFIVAIWAFTGAGFFWPVFPILGWGIGVFLHGWDTYSEPLSEDRIEREVERLRRSSAGR